jgi:4-amino-4-deoxy-L-arabinose transferase-like glycosyltransferase
MPDTAPRDATARAMTSTAVRARPWLSASGGNGAPRVADPPYERTERLPFGLQQGLFLVLLGMILLVRLTHITYNTLFVDEAIYVTVGQDVLHGVFTQNATTFMFGSYLYPVVSAIANDLGGVVGMRTLSAALSTITAVFVYLIASRLFGKQAALWAMAIFGLAGISIELGQLAVYDSLAVPLLAASLYCLVQAATTDEAREDWYLLAAAITFSLSFLAKYITIMCLPALLAIAAALYLSRGRSLRSLVKFPWVTALILVVYVFLFRNDLAQVFKGTNSYQFSTRAAVAHTIWTELGAVLLVALVGAALLGRASLRTVRLTGRWNRITLALAVPVLLITMLSIPLYALYAHNSRSLEKHLVFSLVFLAPLAGYACVTIIQRVRLIDGAWSSYYRATGAVITALALIWFTDYALGRDWGFEHSWPSTAGAVSHLKAAGVTDHDQVLASGSYIYDYYFNYGVAHRSVWHSTWYLAYKGRYGLGAMEAAIHDHWFKYVVLDDYYTPGVAQKLRAPLRRAGYILGYKTSQTLSFGAPIGTRVYMLAPRASYPSRRPVAARALRPRAHTTSTDSRELALGALPQGTPTALPQGLVRGGGHVQH